MRKVYHHEKTTLALPMALAAALIATAGVFLLIPFTHLAHNPKRTLELRKASVAVERGIQFLALTATMGPLMGLLGTVMGMITTFKVISSAGSGDPKMLAAGISEALICTATGMAVAIPALLLHAVLSRKAKAVIGSMEQTSVGFINGVPEEQKSYSF